MQIQLNGEPYELPDETTLAGLLAARGVNALYTAVEVNRELVSRDKHETVILKPNDYVEVVTLVGGGKLPRRPFHLPPAEDVKMQVIHRLTASGAIVDHDTIAAGETGLLSDLWDDRPQVA